jgi:hypothetical protein
MNARAVQYVTLAEVMILAVLFFGICLNMQ